MGIVGSPTSPAYSAAKAGVIGFSKALAKELCDVGVTVNSAAGEVETGTVIGVHVIVEGVTLCTYDR